MAQVLTFRIHIKDLGRKIWRKIEISDRATVADLAYTILASFHSRVTHLYQITYPKNTIYDCGIDMESSFGSIPGLTIVDATITPLSTFHFTGGEVLRMEYDFGSTTEFHIKFLSSEPMKRGTGNHYPYVIDGAGWGMLEDVCDFELKDLVDKTDREGHSSLMVSTDPVFPEHRHEFDYRDYDIEDDNLFLKGEAAQIKAAYEG